MAAAGAGCPEAEAGCEVSEWYRLLCEVAFWACIGGGVGWLVWWYEKHGGA